MTYINQLLFIGDKMIIEGKEYKPFNVVLIGVPGIGKSTWASNAPNPLFIGADEMSELDCARLPQVKSFDEFENQLKWILKEKPKKETLVIDTIDSVEQLLHAKILSEDPKSNGAMAKAHGGFGKAYEMAQHEMIRIRDQYLKPIRDQLGWNIIILSHCKKTTASDTILGLQYDTYEMTLHQKAQNVFVDWVSCVFFANYVAHQADDANSSKVFALGHGERVLLTEKRPGHLGKNRFNLPYEIPLDFNEFHKLFKGFYEVSGPTKEALLASINGLLNNIKDVDLKSRVLKTVADAGSNTKKIQRVLQRVQELTI
jgi:hypothetical protein